jgi:hypothetical protein
MASAGPKNAKVKEAVDRFNLYLADNPEASLANAAKIFDIPFPRIRKWKQYGWLDHIGNIERKALGIPNPPKKPLPSASKRIAAGKVQIPEKVLERLQAPPRTENKKVSGVVAPIPRDFLPKNNEPLTQEEILDIGKNLKVSDLRSMIKYYMQASLADGKEVNQYASALKSMSGVQDIELEESFFNEKMITIYCPEEDAMPEACDIVEVERIEY